MTETETLLVADIGGTNARFAVAEDGRPGASVRLRVADHPDVGAALDTACARLGVAGTRLDLRIAAAGPLDDGTVVLTNAPWTVSEAALATRPGVARVRVVNDFAAIAMALPEFAAGDLEVVGEAPPRRHPAPMLVLGPGTGLGAALAVPAPDGASWIAVATEAGHAGLAVPADPDVRVALSGVADALGGAVTAEDVLSGAGLARLDAIARGGEAGVRDPSAIVAAAAEGERDARRATSRFQGLLGACAGDAGLTCGAFGGVFLTGGVVDALAAAGIWDPAAVRAAFAEKGARARLPAAVPLWRITARDPALIGLAAGRRWVAGTASDADRC